MDEREWLTSPSLRAMLGCELVRGRHRKLRLFGCACVRSVAGCVTDPVALKAIDAAERYADGAIGSSALAKWNVKVFTAPTDAPPRQNVYSSHGVVSLVLYAIGDVTSHDRDDRMRYAAAELGGVKQLSGRRRAGFRPLLREVFGNPFRPMAFDPDWRTATVTALAAGIYADRAFDRLPVLADALDDAGCDAADLLAHLRGDGPHVRGCWALDLVLGKA